MKTMNWSWRELMETPEELVEELVRLLNKADEEEELRRLREE